MEAMVEGEMNSDEYQWLAEDEPSVKDVKRYIQYYKSLPCFAQREILDASIILDRQDVIRALISRVENEDMARTHAHILTVEALQRGRTDLLDLVYDVRGTIDSGYPVSYFTILMRCRGNRTAILEWLKKHGCPPVNLSNVDWPRNRQDRKLDFVIEHEIPVEDDVAELVESRSRWKRRRDLILHWGVS